MSSSQPVKNILFICTGNIFRSMVAEYAVKAHLRHDSRYVIGSAGIEVMTPAPQSVHPFIRDYLKAKGVDLSQHVQRRLTQALLDSADLPVAMGLDHREFIRRQFHREVFLFNEICFQKPDPILDLHEAVPDWHTNLRASRDYVVSVIDHIWRAMPAFLAKLPHV